MTAHFSNAETGLRFSLAAVYPLWVGGTGSVSSIEARRITICLRYLLLCSDVSDLLLRVLGIDFAVR